MSLNYLKKDIKSLLFKIDTHIHINNIGDLGYKELTTAQRHLKIVLDVVKGV